MKKPFLIVYSLLLCCTLYAGMGFAESRAPTGTKRTTVVIVGTIHAYHKNNKDYSAEEVKRILIALKPDAILVEAPTKRIDNNGNIIELFNKDGTLTDFVLKNAHGPELSATNQAAIALGVKQIGIGWRNRNKWWAETKFHKKRNHTEASFKKWLEWLESENPTSSDLKLGQLMEQADKCELEMAARACPNIINSEAFDGLIRIRRSLMCDVLPTVFEKYPEYKHISEYYDLFRDYWVKRHEAMAKNIVDAVAESPGKRFVVIVGAEHRYVLQDLLRDQANIDIKEYWQVAGGEVPKLKEPGISSIPQTQSAEQTGLCQNCAAKLVR